MILENILVYLGWKSQGNGTGSKNSLGAGHCIDIFVFDGCVPILQIQSECFYTETGIVAKMVYLSAGNLWNSHIRNLRTSL